MYEAVQGRMSMSLGVLEEGARYGAPQIVVPRLGQGGFRVLVTEAYHKRCAMAGEKTLPVLDASHIKPFAQGGPHKVSNGLLLRQDIHTLFDRGHITINKDYVIEVSRRIKEEYGNGREYYALHGKILSSLPGHMDEKPSREFLLWHNENVYTG
ncbi:MAG: HNH endonuclease [Thermaerobacter sp.]|nr:HNH endonuclease [Thermaerobacter sp.]